MIISNLNSPELPLYGAMNEDFKKIFDIAKECMKNIPEVGKYFVDGDRVYYMIQSYDTKTEEKVQYEAHAKYIDVQIVLEGEEIIRFDTAEGLAVTENRLEEKDCIKYAMNKGYDTVYLKAGEFALIFPNELHAPGVAVNNIPKGVKKFVAKIRY